MRPEEAVEQRIYESVVLAQTDEAHDVISAA